MAAEAYTARKYLVTLTSDERRYLEDIIGKGRDAAGRLGKARILLKADEGWNDAGIVAALETNRSTVERVRRQFVEEGLEAAISRRKRETPPLRNAWPPGAGFCNLPIRNFHIRLTPATPPGGDK